jgi:hypothetical protein
MLHQDILISLISGFVGSILVCFTSYIANKYGSISGVINTIPFYPMISILGISINSDSLENLQSNIFLSLIGSYSLLFYILLWIYVPYKMSYLSWNNNFKIGLTILLNICFWVSIILPYILYGIPYMKDNYDNKNLIIIAFIVLTMNNYIGCMHKIVTNFDYINNVKELTFYKLIIRFIVCFISITTIILIGKLDESLGTILAIFPLITTINNSIIWKNSKNELLISSISSNTLFCGMGVYGYIISYGLLITHVNIWLSCFISLLLSIVFFNIPFYFIVRKMDSKIGLTKRQIQITSV